MSVPAGPKLPIAHFPVQIDPGPQLQVEPQSVSTKCEHPSGQEESGLNPVIEIQPGPLFWQNPPSHLPTPLRPLQLEE